MNHHRTCVRAFVCIYRAKVLKTFNFIRQNSHRSREEEKRTKNQTICKLLLDFLNFEEKITTDLNVRIPNAMNKKTLCQQKKLKLS